MNRIKYPILRRLLIAQILIVGLGLSILFAAYVIDSQAQVSAAVAHMKSQVTPAIAEKQEQLRAWKYLGLDDAINEEFNQLKKQFPIQTLEVVKKSSLPKKLETQSVVLPTEAPPEDFVVHAIVDTSHLKGAVETSRNLLPILLAVAMLFLATIVLSGRYIYRSIYLPMMSMNQLLFKRSAGETVDLSRTTAAGEMKDFISLLNEMLNKTMAYEKQAAEFNLASQVSHDIRSPLAALNVVLQDLDEISEDKRIMVASAVSRIGDIANNLLKSGKGKEPIGSGVESAEFEQVEKYLLSSVIDSILSEKRLQFHSKKNVTFCADQHEKSFGIFVDVRLCEFKRVLSNLINNSVEAITGVGVVSISVSQDGRWTELKISDTGKGIPTEILPRLGQRGETHGKDGGSGLGLFHARQFVESCRGEITVTSQLGSGTTVTLRLPQASAPTWYLPELKITSSSRLVIVDDDRSIHQVWKKRIESLLLQQNNIDVIHLYSLKELEAWLESTRDSAVRETRILIDYHFIGEERSGLDMIDDLQLHTESILVTSRFEDPAILSRCARMKVALIPKSLAGSQPVIIETPKIRPDAILLDDDLLVHMTWSHFAKQNGKDVRSYSSADVFLQELPKFDRQSAVFIDSNLGDGAKGEDLIPKLQTLGFQRVYLATGSEPEEFSFLPGIRGVVGKCPPENLI